MGKTMTAEEKLGRWEDQREIKNLMGRMSADYTLKKEAEMFDRYWAQGQEDVCLGINTGYFKGVDAVRGYYANQGERIALESRLIYERFPDNFTDKTLEEVYGVGMMTYRPVDTPVIELAEDGATAKGIWCTRGSYSLLTPGGPQGFWEWGWFAVDFIREGDEWKIWHMLYLREIDHPCGSPWTGPKKTYEELPEFAEMKNFRYVEPNVPCTVREEYSASRPFTPSPRLPEPYVTFAETFSYGI